MPMCSGPPENDAQLGLAPHSTAFFLGPMAGGQSGGDRTSNATFTSSNSEVATVDAAGIREQRFTTEPARFSASRTGAERQRHKCACKGAGADFTPSFRNQIIPIDDQHRLQFRRLVMGALAGKRRHEAFAAGL